MIEVVRRRKMRPFVEHEQPNEDVSRDLLSWKRYGFSPVAWLGGKCRGE